MDTLENFAKEECMLQLGVGLRADELIPSPNMKHPPTPVILNSPIMRYITICWEHLMLGGVGVFSIRGRGLRGTDSEKILGHRGLVS